MTVQDLGSIGEFVAAIATLITLVYLARQIRQNTRSVRRSAFQEASRDLAECIDLLVRDPELCRIWFAGARDFDSLPKEERQRFGLYLTGVMRRYENLLFQIEEGALDADALEGVRELLKRSFSEPGLTAWWKNARGLFNRQLREFIEREIL